MPSKSKSPVSVSAQVVREFWQANADKAAEVATAAKVATNSVLGADGNVQRIRGRINPAFYRQGTPGGDFFTAQTGQTYGEKSDAEVRTIEVPRTGRNGRSRKATVMPLSEARTLAGAKAKGRLSSADLARLDAVLTEAGR